MNLKPKGWALSRHVSDLYQFVVFEDWKCLNCECFEMEYHLFIEVCDSSLMDWTNRGSRDWSIQDVVSVTFSSHSSFICISLQGQSK